MIRAIKFIYMMTATNKQYSYPRVVAILIDVYHVGENPINTSHAFHAQFMYGPRLYVSYMVHIEQPFT
jgi:hypothetical protein